LDLPVFYNVHLFIQCGYSSPTEADMIQDLNLTISQVLWIFLHFKFSSLKWRTTPKNTFKKI